MTTHHINKTISQFSVKTFTNKQTKNFAASTMPLYETLLKDNAFCINNILFKAAFKITLK